MSIEIALANLLALLHGLAVIALVVAPFVFVAARRRIRWLEQLFLVVGGVTASSYLATGECFLTTWEQRLRVSAAQETAYTSGFVSHYLSLAGINWPDGLTVPAAIILMTVGFGRLLHWLWLDLTRKPR